MKTATKADEPPQPRTVKGHLKPGFLRGCDFVRRTADDGPEEEHDGPESVKKFFDGIAQLLTLSDDLDEADRKLALRCAHDWEQLSDAEYQAAWQLIETRL